MTEPLSTRMRIAADTLEDLAKHLEYPRPDFDINAKYLDLSLNTRLRNAALDFTEPAEGTA